MYVEQANGVYIIWETQTILTLAGMKSILEMFMQSQNKPSKLC